MFEQTNNAFKNMISIRKYTVIDQLVKLLDISPDLACLFESIVFKACQFHIRLRDKILMGNMEGRKTNLHSFHSLVC